MAPRLQEFHFGSSNQPPFACRIPLARPVGSSPPGAAGNPRVRVNTDFDHVDWGGQKRCQTHKRFNTLTESCLCFHRQIHSGFLPHPHGHQQETTQRVPWGRVPHDFCSTSEIVQSAACTRCADLSTIVGLLPPRIRT